VFQFHDQQQIAHNNHYSSLIRNCLNDPYHGINLPVPGAQEAEIACKFYAAFLIFEEKLPTEVTTMHEVANINGKYSNDLGFDITGNGLELAIALAKKETTRHN
jgi:hypothetical protein